MIRGFSSWFRPRTESLEEETQPLGLDESIFCDAYHDDKPCPELAMVKVRVLCARKHDRIRQYCTWHYDLLIAGQMQCRPCMLEGYATTLLGAGIIT